MADARDALECAYCTTPLPPRRGRGLPRRFCTKRCNRRYDRAQRRREARAWRRLVPLLHDLRDDAQNLQYTVHGRPRLRDLVDRVANLDLAGS